MSETQRRVKFGTLHAMPAARSAIRPDASPTLFRSAKAFETWLKKNHATSDGLWLKIAKRGANELSVTYVEAVEALCHHLQVIRLRSNRDAWKLPIAHDG